jgi:hypothetical protein
MRSFLKFSWQIHYTVFSADVTNIEFMSVICLPVQNNFTVKNMVNIFTVNISSLVV